MTRGQIALIDKTTLFVNGSGVVSLNYLGVLGTLTFDSENQEYVGKIQGISGLVLYAGKSLDLLVEDFQTAVDDFLKDWPSHTRHGYYRVPKNPPVDNQGEDDEYGTED